MIKFINLLKEGGVISPLLYHVTNVNRVLSILKNNQFMLTPTIGTDSDERHQKKFYFLSTSRIKYGGYVRSLNKRGLVNLELDGKKLGNKYKSINVDYWGGSFRDTAWEQGNYQKFLRYNENEERIVSDDPYIKPATKFLNSIHVNVENVENYRDNTKRKLAELESEAKNKNIPIYFYDDFDDFKIQNTKEADKSIFTKLDYEEKAKTKKWSLNTDRLEAVIDIMNVKTVDDLSDKSKQYYNTLRNGTFTKDFIKGLKNEIHNNKSEIDARPTISKFIEEMKKHGKREINQFIKNVVVPKAEKLNKKDYDHLREKYERVVLAMIDVFESTANNQNATLESLSNNNSLDILSKYFDFSDGDMGEWSNQSQEKAYKVINHLGKLIQIGYFDKLSNILNNLSYRGTYADQVRKFVQNDIRNGMRTIAKNENWNYWFR